MSESARQQAKASPEGPAGKLITLLRLESAAEVSSRFPALVPGTPEWEARYGDLLDGNARRAARDLHGDGRHDDAREIARALAAPAGEPVPGAPVSYHGSKQDHHGTWQVDGPCPCWRCDTAAADGFPRRLRLTSPEWPDPLLHVSWLSVSPLPPGAPATSEEE